MKQITLPIGFDFSLQNKFDGSFARAPRAFDGREWRTWENAPEGVEYEVMDIELPTNWEYTVGPACRVIRWNANIWEPTLEESAWASAGWPIIEAAQPQPHPHNTRAG